MAIKFRGVDFLEFDSLLTDDERLVRDTTRKFIEDNLIPIIEECNRAGRFPKELVKPMADLGLYGASLKGYGCAGMSNVEYGLVMQELERGDSGVRSFVSVHSSLAMYPIYAFGSDEQKQAWLPADAEGREDRLLRPDRARLRFQSRRHAHSRQKVGQGIRPQRRENVDHVGLHRRRRDHLGQGRKTKTTRSAAFWSKPIAPASAPRTFTASGRCALRLHPASPCRTFTSRNRTCCQKPEA